MSVHTDRELCCHVGGGVGLGVGLDVKVEVACPWQGCYLKWIPAC